MSETTELLSEITSELRCGYDGCLNFPPGPNAICDDCLSAMRAEDSAADYDRYDDYLREQGDSE